MDLLNLSISETPTDLIFAVSADGLEEEADYDAGNYFVYIKRGSQHYTIRMYQDNTGTGAIAEVIPTEGVSVFGPIGPPYPADVTGNTITATIPRSELLDQDGSEPIRGHTMDQILVSAEAHATGVYVCPDDSGSGPYIVRDRMPNAWIEEAEQYTFALGGASIEGALDVIVERPLRGSNGEATTYPFPITITNLDSMAHQYVLSTQGQLAEWTWQRPNGSLILTPGESTSFTALLSVPFRHVHGATDQMDFVVEAVDGSAKGAAQIGIHYFATAQPSGHHQRVFVHTAQQVGGLQPTSEAAGSGYNEAFWNTLEDDETDQSVTVTMRGHASGYHLYSCLSPRLSMGLSPGSGLGSYEFSFQSDAPITGTFTGTIYRASMPEQRSRCSAADNFGRDFEPLMQLGEQELGAAGSVTGEVTLQWGEDLPLDSMTNLVLELRVDVENSIPGGLKFVGGEMVLPLADYHEAISVDLNGSKPTPAAGFAPDEPASARESPALGVLALLAMLAVLAWRRQ